MKPVKYAIFYFICIIPPYFLTLLGSNEWLYRNLYHKVPPIGYSFSGTGLWLFVWHLLFLGLLCLLAWRRGKAIQKIWLVIFPIIATVVQLAPFPMIETPYHLAFPLYVRLIPIMMHICAIVIGVLPDRKSQKQQA